MNHCAACGKAVNADAKFCSGCGASATAVVDATAPAANGKSRKKLFIGATLAVVLLGGGVAVAAGGGESYGACMANPNKTYAECQASHGRGTAGSNSPTTVSTQQPKTCLQWKTNYTQRYVNGPDTGFQNGTGIAPMASGHWEQVPSGQTCVRYG